MVRRRSLLRGAGLLRAVALGSALISAPSWAASFDCAKAATPDEKAVCANAKLSDLDGLMGRAYTAARAKADPGDRGKVLSDAHAFLSQRHGCGSDAACLTSAYVGVLEDFAGYGSDVEVPATVSALDMVAAVPGESKALPIREGQCVATRIESFAGRLEGDTTFESGTSVAFANEGTQVSYDKVPAIIQSHPGDRVLMCLTAIPKHCPPGDDRGRMYTTTNLRTHATWSLPVTQHSCGGA